MLYAINRQRSCSSRHSWADHACVWFVCTKPGQGGWRNTQQTAHNIIIIMLSTAISIVYVSTIRTNLPTIPRTWNKSIDEVCIRIVCGLCEMARKDINRLNHSQDGPRNSHVQSRAGSNIQYTYTKAKQQQKNNENKQSSLCFGARNFRI